MHFSSRAVWIGVLAMVCATVISGEPNVRAQNNQKQIPRAKAVADTLKSDLDKFMLFIHLFAPKEKEPGSLMLLTAKTDKVKARGVVVIITKEAAATIVDRLLEAGVFDKIIPPIPGIPAPGWYLQIGLVDARPKYYIWPIGATTAEFAAHPAVKTLQKTLQADAKTGLERLLEKK